MAREKKTPAVRLAQVRKQITAAREWLAELEQREAAIVAEAKEAAAALLAQVGAGEPEGKE